MCLAIPGKVIQIEDNTAYVEFGSIKRKIDIRLLEDIKEGDYVLVHAGFAIEKVDEEEAVKTLKIFENLAVSFEELT